MNWLTSKSVCKVPGIQHQINSIYKQVGIKSNFHTVYCVEQVCRALNVCILKMDKSNHLINDIGMIDK
jgi:hypothetical protein